ncbi:5-hydroxyisourate hydrolase [Scopulibacillus darangshiensis]|uniref:5-hydroxyisourate hydrolase n=1 Tax=Scopulibacillus darangshiensis TaxID=442528 RepID=A0A4R2NKG7_9BACL|nr:hydroxyisourate hydrolase [Scopulibacillus darangshiensis]TCP21654.1 5-hydroxyisourate hydrolase [Scopulibacillus darangshiensis]
MNGYLTTHVLDMTRGVPAADCNVALWRIEKDGRMEHVITSKTNSDGRVDAPLLQGEACKRGTYELVFHVADYFRSRVSLEEQPFLQEVPIRFCISDPDAHYHVPLLVAPGGYSTYRGS